MEGLVVGGRWGKAGGDGARVPGVGDPRVCNAGEAQGPARTCPQASVPQGQMLSLLPLCGDAGRAVSRPRVQTS